MYSGRHTRRAYSTKRRSVPAHARACVETRILVDQLASVIDSPPANLLHLCDDLVRADDDRAKSPKIID